MTLSVARRGSRAVVAAAAVAICCAVDAAPAFAQAGAARRPSQRKWTLEVHGGIGIQPAPAGSPGQLPAGSAFGTASGSTSRANASWFFGDGALLFNQVKAQFATLYRVQFAEIVPLDAVITTRAFDSPRTPGFGVRVARSIVRRVALELSIDQAEAKPRLSGATRDAIEATRASFESGFRGLLGTIPQTGLQVASTAEVVQSRSSETSLTAAVVVSPIMRGGLTVYALAGGGQLRSEGTPIEVRLRGQYQFRVFDQYPINESDSVVIRVTRASTVPMAVVGAGVTIDIGARLAVRVDVRDHIGRTGFGMTLDASPAVSAGTPAIAVPSLTTPSVQFSTVSGVRSSLSGTTTGLQTFTSGRQESRLLTSAGLVLRF